MNGSKVKKKKNYIYKQMLGRRRQHEYEVDDEKLLKKYLHQTPKNCSLYSPTPCNSYIGT